MPSGCESCTLTREITEFAADAVNSPGYYALTSGGFTCPITKQVFVIEAARNGKHKPEISFINPCPNVTSVSENFGKVP